MCVKFNSECRDYPLLSLKEIKFMLERKHYMELVNYVSSNPVSYDQAKLIGQDGNFGAINALLENNLMSIKSGGRNLRYADKELSRFAQMLVQAIYAYRFKLSIAEQKDLIRTNNHELIMLYFRSGRSFKRSAASEIIKRGNHEEIMALLQFPLYPPAERLLREYGEDDEVRYYRERHGFADRWGYRQRGY